MKWHNLQENAEVISDKLLEISIMNLCCFVQTASRVDQFLRWEIAFQWDSKGIQWKNLKF